MHHPTDRIAHTTAFITPVVEHWLEREIAQWVHPMKDRSDIWLRHLGQRAVSDELPTWRCREHAYDMISANVGNT